MSPHTTSSGSALEPRARYRLPDVVMIGAAKSGTTSLAKRLDQHPRVCLANPKEPEYFSHDERFVRGPGWYDQVWDAAQPGQLLLDASTAYTRFPQHPRTAARLARHCPHAKLIYLMRHPVDRAYSHFVHRFTKELFPGRPFDRSFEAHVLQDPMCLDSSDYKTQIELYLEHFPREQLLLLFTHQLARDEANTLRRVAEFLEIDPDLEALRAVSGQRENVMSDFRESRVRIQVTNAIKSLPAVRELLPLVPPEWRERGYAALRLAGMGRKLQRGLTPPPMQPATRELLLERFRASNAWVAELTGEDLSAWDR